MNGYFAHSAEVRPVTRSESEQSQFIGFSFYITRGRHVHQIKKTAYRGWVDSLRDVHCHQKMHEVVFPASGNGTPEAFIGFLPRGTDSDGTDPERNPGSRLAAQMN